jgi:glycerol uptake facilitator-like aquaporin
MKLLKIAPVFIALIMMGTGVNALITIDSPLNITYNSSSVELNVSSNSSGTVWTYSLDGGANVTFTPNTTLTGLSKGHHNLSVFFSQGGVSVAYGNGTYGNGTYGGASVSLTIEGEYVEFDSIFKQFLMEIFITFELMAFVLMIRGFRRHDQIVNTLLAMGLFFALAILGLSVEQITGNVAYYSPMATWINFGFGMLCLLFLFVLYMNSLERNLTP